MTEFNCPPDCRDDVDPSFYQAVRLLTTSTYTLFTADPEEVDSVSHKNVTAPKGFIYIDFIS